MPFNTTTEHKVVRNVAGRPATPNPFADAVAASWAKRSAPTENGTEYGEVMTDVFPTIEEVKKVRNLLRSAGVSHGVTVESSTVPEGKGHRVTFQSRTRITRPRTDKTAAKAAAKTAAKA